MFRKLLPLSFLFFLFPTRLFSEEIRNTSTPQTIIVEYMSYSCGDFYPRLYKETRDKRISPHEFENEKEMRQRAVLLALPPDLFSPEDVEQSVGGNRFILRGYSYKKISFDPSTGQKMEEPSRRFDLISWEIIAPYKVFVRVKDGVQLVQKSFPVQYSVDETKLTPKDFKMSRYDGCL